MLSVLRVLLSGLILTKYISTESVEESYRHIFPFCYNNTYCRHDCICDNYFNCKLLPMDEFYRSSVLYFHNHIREVIGSKGEASGMTMLEYDLDLEQISICWASKCTNEHTSCFFTPRYTSTSQSVTQILLEEGTYADLDIWMRKVDQDMHSILSTNEPFSHNLAQICSDNILSMGCAWSLSLNHWLTLVCTYGPSGARQTEKIFQTGPTCAECPVNYECDHQEPFAKLCKPKKTELESLQENVYSFETPPRFPSHPEVPTVSQSAKVSISTFSDMPPRLPALSNISLTTSATSSVSSTVEPQLYKTTGNVQMRPARKAGDADEEDNKKEKLHNWLVIGTILTLLVLALICAVTAVCIYTHGFGCR